MIIHYKFRYIYLWIYYANLSFPVWIRPWFAHRKHICIILVLDTTDYVPPFDIFDTNMYSKHAIYPFIVIIPHWKGLSANALVVCTRYFFFSNNSIFCGYIYANLYISCNSMYIFYVHVKNDDNMTICLR